MKWINREVAVDVLGLEAFIQIAEAGSFRRAAVTMNLSQTALSHRIRKLEADVGLSLFERTTRTVTLTRVGEDFLPRARDMMGRLRAVYDELKAEGRKTRERVGVGCLASLGELYLPRVLPAFRDHHPDTTVVIYDGNAAMLGEKVASGEAQFALTILGAQRWGQKQQALYEEEFAAAVPSGHPLATRPALEWSDLAGHPLARVSTSTSHGLMISENLGDLDQRLDWRYEVQRTHMAASLVLAGVAITVLPRAAIPLTEAIRVVPIGTPTIKRTVGLISRDGVRLPASALQLQRMLLREIATAQRGTDAA